MKVSRTTIWILLAMWMLCMLFAGLSLSETPIGDGFTRGQNRMSGFLSWQLVGGMLALMLWVLVRPLPKGDRLRWVGLAPIWLAVALLIVVVSRIGYALLTG
ncbi:hypothetical protein E2K80_17260 [Rhodophyticola sp. CCM32]|uniref:hypothetical protein n=1 Tax=Rhodophyticola sp. CCM32 TaxID=2916397 RepID=UPI00107F0955|nr:hypothetical protein [Rhodophyticola sp. CCM32]QBY02270.1 hypothetical protein E2K80_17260 [Rhodophyticola sp. CCM32]